MRAPSALIRAASRLLCRAALFLWMMRLSAIASITDCSDLNAASAAALSPASMALWIFLIAVRSVAQGQDPKSACVCDAMTDDLIFCYEDEDVEQAAKLMEPPP